MGSISEEADGGLATPPIAIEGISDSTIPNSILPPHTEGRSTFASSPLDALRQRHPTEDHQQQVRADRRGTSRRGTGRRIDVA
jgi:hypothetical protein